MAPAFLLAMLATALTPADVRNSLQNKGFLIAGGYQDLVECAGGQGALTSPAALDTDNRKGLPMPVNDLTTLYSFRPIPDFPAYRLGPDGRVQSCRKRGGAFQWSISDQWRDLIPNKHSRGHLYVRLSNSSGSRSIQVHRLVLEVFVGPPPFRGAQCRHLDGNPANNRVENLKWGTSRENKADELRHGTRLRGSRHRDAKLTEADIPEIRRLIAEGQLTYPEIGARFGVRPTAIYGIRADQTWKHIEGNKDKIDELRYGTRRRGSRHHSAKLTEADIPEIRRLLASGKLTLAEIGERFGVTMWTISRISRGKAWEHVNA